MIEIETQYTLETYKEYFWFSLFRGKYYRFGKAAFPFLSATIILLLILSIFWNRSSLAIAVCAAGSALCILFYIIAHTVPKRYVKRAPLLFQTKNSFRFDDDAMHLTQKGDIASGTSTVKYEALYKAYETKNAIYLYISPRQAYLLSKKDFIKGTPAELRQLLQTKLAPKKYIVCK